MAGFNTPGRKAEDLTDKVFGRLTVIGRASDFEKRKSNDIYWLCICECGEETIVMGKSLKRGTTTSCGCKRKEKLIDLTGKRFGKLLVLRRVEAPDNSKIKNRPYWLCKCKCGKYKTILGLNLRKNYTTSCGCYRSSTLEERKLSRA
jgi:hypothetical protein